MLVEIHMLQNYAPSNLNRDDTGSPKDCIFGGIRRTRISSQCLKRSIRRSGLFSEGLNNTGLAIRTRRLPLLIKEKLLEMGVRPEMADLAELKATGFGNKEGKEREKELNTAQTMFLTRTDIDILAQHIFSVIQNCKNTEEFKKITAKDLQVDNLLKKWRSITPDLALFGRMITSDAFLDVEASVQVAHAISTNKMDHEFDYFTAVDDLQLTSGDDDNSGADMIGDFEFSSACFYKYFSIDTDALVNNLAGPEKGSIEENKNYENRLTEAKVIANATVSAFLEASIFASPSGKQNSFAAHQLPDAILIEVRDKNVPVSYANAFLKPARPFGDRDLVDDSVHKLIEHVKTINKKFSLKSAKRLWFSTRGHVLEGADMCETTADLLARLHEALVM